MHIVLAPFQALIKSRYGISLEDAHNAKKLQDAIAHYMHRHQLTQTEHFISLLTQSPATFQDFINELTINETYFFREPEQLEFLVDTLVPQILARTPVQNSGERIRIFSAGSSSGEEAYSIVMMLTERYGDLVAQRFEISGGDIDSQVLLKAQRAEYGEFSFRNVSPERRNRFFTKRNHLNLLSPSIQKQVTFFEFNLATVT